MRLKLRQQAGFTLVEAIVGMLILSLVAVALAGTFMVGYSVISQEARQIAAAQAVSSASLTLLRDMTSATSISTGTISPGAGSLSFTYGAPGTTAFYTVDAGNNLIRTVGGAARVAARGIQSVSVAAGAPACYYTITLQPSAAGSAARTLNLSQRIGTQGCF
jgi:prepilin-type N-terminal cleavage/methylation domain-containing protein